MEATDATKPDPDVLTVDEAAARLRLDRKTLYAMIKCGEVQGARRFGRALRLHWPTVVAWLASGQGRASRARR